MADMSGASRGQLRATVQQLSARLERGWALCDQALAAGDMVRLKALEDYWLDLLAEYEATCRLLWLREATPSRA